MNFSEIADKYFQASLTRDGMLANVDDALLARLAELPPDVALKNASESEMAMIKRSAFNAVVLEASKKIMLIYKFLEDDESFDVCFDNVFVDAGVFSWINNDDAKYLLKNSIESKVILFSKEVETNNNFLDITVEIRHIVVPKYGIAIYITPYLNCRDNEFLENVVLPQQKLMNDMMEKLAKAITDENDDFPDIDDFDDDLGDFEDWL